MADVLQFSTEGGKLLTFRAGERIFGFIINDVTDIIEIPEIVSIPTAPAHVPGLINLRGKAVPVIDLRLKMGFKEGEYDEQSCLIVVEINTLQCAVRVDRVIDVIDVAPESIALSPAERSIVSCFVTLKQEGQEDQRVFVIDPDRFVRSKGGA